jgi:nucleoside-diphosphate-sugar epimerase
MSDYEHNRVFQSDLVDVNSRHSGKLKTEAYLHKIGIPYTAIRPTYIYGAMNYNPLGKSWEKNTLHMYSTP